MPASASIPPTETELQQLFVRWARLGQEWSELSEQQEADVAVLIAEVKRLGRLTEDYARLNNKHHARIRELEAQLTKNACHQGER